MAKVYLGKGSNLGYQESNIVRALELLGAMIRLLRWPSLYETAPLGYLDQPRFFNAACAGTTRLGPLGLLRFIKGIEAFMGRTRSLRWGLRLIDIDILFTGPGPGHTRPGHPSPPPGGAALRALSPGGDSPRAGAPGAGTIRKGAREEGGTGGPGTSGGGNCRLESADLRITL
ncbi:MAG: 2-amino-4-hydroxy-6-hydroxymethyldihydropteridine diphosphokinase [Chloroflexi bacterium]|nr:2-amino-4-hydroxy-6-hydroxymethyldihydropteridine diphosphokinase [Chloroflexota bacterium]